MRYAKKIAAAFAAIIAVPAIACAATIGGVWYAPQYDYTDFWAVADNKPFQVILQGNPFPNVPFDEVAQALLPAMQVAKPRNPAYFRAALRLLRQLHAANVIHNDLAKETNWLVTPDGRPALVDFQLAMTLTHRGALARSLGHDDLRHLLKHKRTYVAGHLTARELRILAKSSLISRIWMASGKKVYLFVTRRVLRWRDREGAGDRGQ